MTVNQLFEALQELVNEGKGDLPVLIAYQPNYPMQTEAGRTCFCENGKNPAFYICEAPHYSGISPYLPGDVSEELGFK